MICAIHQPNFFPWLGYFDKIRRADVFVFLDAVDYPRHGSHGMGSWSNRVRIDVQGHAHWIGCPIERASSRELIQKVRIAEHSGWRRKVQRTLEQSYRKQPGFERAMPLITGLLGLATESLAELNINAITRISEALGLTFEFVRQSALDVAGSATERLINITRAVGCDTYLCGGGAAGYQDDAAFAAHGVNLLYQDFTPFSYGDPARFLPGLSVLDFMLKCADWTWPDD